MSVATATIGLQQPILLGRRWPAVFVRMAWKELRVVSPFLFVVAISMGGLAVLVAFAWRNRLNDAWTALYGIVVLFPLLFSLGCGGLSYAGEKEDGTWDWLRRIAAPSSAVCAAKMLVGLVGGVLLASVAWWTLTWFSESSNLRDRVNELGSRRLTVFLIGVSITLLLSQIVSTLVKNVFVALIVAGVFLAPVLTVVLALATDHTGLLAKESLNEWRFFSIVSGWLLCLFALIICEFSLADCWLKDVPFWRGGLIGYLMNPPEHQRWILSANGYRQQPLTHLMSREWSLAKPWLWSFTLMLIIPFGIGLFLRQRFRGDYPYQIPSMSEVLWSYFASPVTIVASGMLVLIPTLLGVWAFQPDQRDLRFRFLADRGVTPNGIWLSKHLVRVPMLLAMLCCVPLVFCVCLPVIGPDRAESFLQLMSSLVAVEFSYALMTYSSGQLMGQLIRSPITSSFLAAVSGILLAGWLACLRILQMPWVFDVATIAIPLAASWLRTCDWLLERTNWRSRLRLAASLLIPFGLLYGGMGLYRSNSLPKVTSKPPTIAEMKEFLVRKKGLSEAYKAAEQQLDETYRREYSNLSAELAPIRARWTTWWQSREPFPPGVQGGFTSPRPAQGPLSPEDLTALQALFPDQSREQFERHVSGFASALQSEVNEQGHLLNLARLMEERFLFDRPAKQQVERRRDLFERLMADMHLKHFRETRSQFVALRQKRKSGVAGNNAVQTLMRGLAEWSAERGDFASAVEILSGFGTTTDLRRDQVQRLLEFAAGCRDSMLVKGLIREWSEAIRGTRGEIDLLRNQLSVANDPNDDERLIAECSLLLPRHPAAVPLMRLFPWELSLARREFNLSSFRRLAVLEAIDDVIHDRNTNRIRWIELTKGQSLYGQRERLLPVNSEFDAPSQPIALLAAAPQYDDGYELSSPNQRPVDRSWAISREVERRQVILLLALIAWRIDHEDFPDRLEPLVGGYLDQLPRDPLSGEAFEYQKSPMVAVKPPSVAKGNQFVPLLRVQSPNEHHDVWREIHPSVAPFEMPDAGSKTTLGIRVME